MDTFMTAQVRDLSKLTVAKSAHEVPDSIVYALVLHQSGLMLEPLVTIGAANNNPYLPVELAIQSVSALMAPHFSFSYKDFFARRIILTLKQHIIN